MTSWEFNATGPIEAEISLAAGSVQLSARQTQTVTVSLLAHRGGGAGDADKLIADTEVSFADGTLTVEVPKRLRLRGDTALDLRIELPEGSAVSVSTASADVSCDGELGSLDGHTASGEITVDRVSGKASLVTASGDVLVTAVAADVSVMTSSGDVSVQQAGGDFSAQTASGDVRLGQAGQSAEVKTASGDVRIDAIAAGRANLTSVSGDIAVAVRPGTGVYLDLSSLSGHVGSDLDSESGGGATELSLRCNTVSGDISVTRAVATS